MDRWLAEPQGAITKSFCHARYLATAIPVKWHRKVIVMASDIIGSKLHSVQIRLILPTSLVQIWWTKSDILLCSKLKSGVPAYYVRREQIPKIGWMSSRFEKVAREQQLRRGIGDAR